MEARSNSGKGSEMDVLDEELWRACAGPQAEVPRVGDMVFYFPQGHIEQLEASMSEDLNQQIPLYDLSSQILCRVVNVQLQAERETDEVFAQITLQPEVNETEPTGPDFCIPELPSHRVRSFSKILTPSDTSSHGGFSVLRRHAMECLPSLDMSEPIPSQELIAKDIHGYPWRFKHIFRGQPKRHLLTTGWTTFVNAKRLVTGDTFIFLRGENGEMRVGARRAQQLSAAIPPVLSSQSMLMGVVATASHAFSTKTLFTIFLKPRTSRFIVRLDKYIQAARIRYAVGMKFKMNFGEEDDPATSFTGTILEIGSASAKWPNSKWRGLKVLWDEASAIYRPDRVSPWEIEPVLPPAPELAMSEIQLDRNKRPRELNDAHWIHWPASQHEMTMSGNQGRHEVGNQVSAMAAGNLNQGNRSINEGCLIEFPSSAKSLSSSMTDNISEKPSKDPRKIEVGNTSCRLFGVDLRPNRTATVYKEISLLDKLGKNLVSEEVQNTSKRQNVAPKERETMQRSCIKVHKQDEVVGRAINLTVLDGYERLANELERMFKIQSGDLLQCKKWEIAFTDEEGDIMRVGDEPWLEFCNMAKHIFIYAKGTVLTMNPGDHIPYPFPSFGKAPICIPEGCERRT